MRCWKNNRTYFIDQECELGVETSYYDFNTNSWIKLGICPQGMYPLNENAIEVGNLELLVMTGYTNASDR